MRKLLLSLLVLIPSVANASFWASKPVQCGTHDEVIAVVSKYGEVPVVTFDGVVGMPSGSTASARFVISINDVSKSWTLLEFTEEQGCILGSGKGEISFPIAGIKT